MAIWNYALSKITSILGIHTTTAGSALETLLEAREAERVAQVRNFRDFYDGKSIPYITAEGELPYINICYAVVEKGVSWLINPPPKLRGRQDIQPIIDELVAEVLENSGGEQFWRESLVEGSVTGDLIIKADIDPDANEGDGGVHLKVMDSERTFVEYLNTGQRKKLNRVMVVWDELDEEGKVTTYLEIWDKEHVRVYPPGPVTSSQGMILQSGSQSLFQEVQKSTMDDYGNEYRIYEHPFGELPFVHIPNITIPHNVHGRSDLHDLWILNREYNEQLLSYKDNVDYHGNPLTIIKGASAKDIEKGANRVWSNLPLEAQIENLTVPETHGAILEYMKILDKAMGYSSIPEYILASKDQINSESSGVAMKLSFLPMVEFADRKKASYGPGYAAAFEMALRFINRFSKLGLEKLNAPDPKTVEKIDEFNGRIAGKQRTTLKKLREIPFYRLTIEFQDHLPRNKTALLADITTAMQNNLETIPGALKTLGELDIPGKMAELLGDADFRRQLIELSTPAQPGAPPPPPGEGEEPSPTEVEEATGQSAERTAEQRALNGTGDI